MLWSNYTINDHNLQYPGHPVALVRLLFAPRYAKMSDNWEATMTLHRDKSGRLRIYLEG